MQESDGMTDDSGEDLDRTVGEVKEVLEEGFRHMTEALDCVVSTERELFIGDLQEPPLVHREFREKYPAIAKLREEIMKSAVTSPASSRSHYLDLAAFHAKFGLTPNLLPDFLPEDVERFRLDFLQEELDEIRDAAEAGDLPKMFDGLLDLVYVAIGTAHLMGLPWQDGWDEVQRANMAKERASGADDERSTRKHSADVVKPEGWAPPDIEGVLRRYGWRGGR